MNRLYGFSDVLTCIGYLYGSVLGSAYAATFTNNIRRIAHELISLIGVLNVNRWFFDQQFLLSLYVDSDTVLDDFFHLYFLAGTDYCAFWHPSLAEVHAAFIAVDNKIHRAPVEVGLNRRRLDRSRKDQLRTPSAEAADALLEYTARVPGREMLVDPATGLGNGVESAEVIAAVDNLYSWTDIDDLMPFFNSL
ncbi:MAG: hypothetical protein Q9210_004400 [Variospora velana]